MSFFPDEGYVQAPQGELYLRVDGMPGTNDSDEFLLWMSGSSV